MDTKTCLNATMKFIARRGKPNIIISDKDNLYCSCEKICRVSRCREQRRDRRTFNSTRNQMEVQPTRSTSLCWKAIYAVLGHRSLTKDVHSTTMRVVEQTLNARSFTPLSSDVNGLEALTTNQFLLGNEGFGSPYLP